MRIPWELAALALVALQDLVGEVGVSRRPFCTSSRSSSLSRSLRALMAGLLVEGHGVGRHHRQLRGLDGSARLGESAAEAFERLRG